MHKVLENLLTESEELRSFLGEQSQITMLRSADDNARKALVLSAASLFEYRITEALIAYAERVTEADGCIVSLIRNKAIKRQYHTFFDWERGSAKSFFTLLGDTLGGCLKTECVSGRGKDNVSAFLEIGQLRNCLVHQNFAAYVVNQSSHELAPLIARADCFVERVEKLLSGTSGDVVNPGSSDSL